MADEFAKSGSNTILRAYEYTGFDPLIKDSEGWTAAIKRFNPTNQSDEDESGDSDDDLLPDPYTQRYKQELRKEVCMNAINYHDP